MTKAEQTLLSPCSIRKCRCFSSWLPVLWIVENNLKDQEVRGQGGRESKLKVMTWRRPAQNWECRRKGFPPAPSHSRLCTGLHHPQCCIHAGVHQPGSVLCLLFLALNIVLFRWLTNFLWIYTIFTKSKFLLLATQQANKSREELLGQEIVTLFRKSADWGDSGLMA